MDIAATLVISSPDGGSVLKLGHKAEEWRNAIASLIHIVLDSSMLAIWSRIGRTRPIANDRDLRSPVAVFLNHGLL